MKTKFLFLFIFCVSCSNDYTPKPRAYVKFSFPNKEYQFINVDCPFSFKIPQYASISKYDRDCLFNLDFLDQNAKLHITYHKLNNNLYEHTEQSRDLAYKHNVKANAISEQIYSNDSTNVYGIVYDFDGYTATSIQFFLTDSINHFFRGALYFNTEINDSIEPLNLFLKKDIKLLVESFSWKE